MKFVLKAKVGRGMEVKAVLLGLRGPKSDVSDETAEILVSIYMY